MACSLSYCIFPNALVMQHYVTLSVTNIDYTSKTNNSWYKSPITAWNMPFERYDSYLSPNVKKQPHSSFFHVYFNGFLPPFNFLFHPLEVSYTDNILSIGSNHLKNILTFIIIDVIMFTAATNHPWIKLNEIYEVLNIVFLLTILSPRNIGVSTIDQSHECEWIIWTMERQFSKINFVSTQF